VVPTTGAVTNSLVAPLDLVNGSFGAGGKSVLLYAEVVETPDLLGLEAPVVVAEGLVAATSGD